MLKKAFQEFLVAAVADGKAPRTIKDYQRALKPFISWCEERGIYSMSQLRPMDAREYVASLRERHTHWKAATWAIHVRIVKTFLGWGYREGKMKEDISLAIRSPKPRVKIEVLPSLEEIALLLKTTERGYLKDLRDRSIILTLLDTGMRVGELVKLSLRDWQTDNDGRSQVIVFASKTQTYRIVFLGQESTRALVEYLESRKRRLGELDLSMPLFAGRKNDPITDSAIRRMLGKRARKAGLDPKKFHPHIFRKLLVTSWINEGGNTILLQYLVGWTSPAMVKFYLLSSVQKIKEAHIQLGLADRIKVEM